MNHHRHASAQRRQERNLEASEGSQGASLQDRLCYYVDAHANIIAIVLITLLSLAMRASALDYESRDYTVFLLPWYEASSETGLGSLRERIGNYSPAYQTLIALITYLPVSPLVGYKVISIAFDYLLALAGALLVRKIAPHDARHAPTVAYCVIACWPAIAINSAVWAQCDSIWTAFCLLSILCLISRKNVLSMVFFGLALSFKLQAVLLLPLFLFAGVRRSDFPLSLLGIAFLTMFSTSIGAVLAGRPPLDILSVYLAQSDTYHNLFLNCPSFWALFGATSKVVDYDTAASQYDAFGAFAVCLTAAIIVIEIFLLVRYRVRFTPVSTLRMAFVFAFTAVLFLPAMHERYVYLAETLGIVLMIHDRRLILPVLTCASTTIVTYGSAFIEHTAIDYRTLAFVNIAGFAVIAFLFLKDASASNNRTPYASVPINTSAASDSETSCP